MKTISDNLSDPARDNIRAIIDLSVEVLRLLDEALDQGEEQEAREILKRYRSSVETSLTAAEHKLANRVIEKQ